MTGKIVCPRCKKEIDTVYDLCQDLVWDDEQQGYIYLDGGECMRVCGYCADTVGIDVDPVD